MRTIDVSPDDIANLAAAYARIYRNQPLGEDLRNKSFRQRPERRFTFDTVDRDGEMLRFVVCVEKNPNAPKPPPANITVPRVA